MSDRLLYENPLNTRYASREMQENFGDEKRFRLWRKLWIALAESEMELGLGITPAQVEAGDQVIFSKYSGTEVKVDDEEYIIVKQNDILAVIK